jgi:hypothetical protein
VTPDSMKLTGDAVKAVADTIEAKDSVTQP